MERHISEYRSDWTRPRSRMATGVQSVGEPMRTRLSRTAGSLGQFIVQNPAVSLGLALSLGVVLGWLIKRR